MAIRNEIAGNSYRLREHAKLVPENLRLPPISSPTKPKKRRGRPTKKKEELQHSDNQAAVRALAFKWIRILYRCWKTRTPYNEARYLRALQERGSPVLMNAETA